MTRVCGDVCNEVLTSERYDDIKRVVYEGVQSNIYRQLGCDKYRSACFETLTLSCEAIG